MTCVWNNSDWPGHCWECEPKKTTNFHGKRLEFPKHPASTQLLFVLAHHFRRNMSNATFRGIYINIITMTTPPPASHSRKSRQQRPQPSNWKPKRRDSEVTMRREGQRWSTMVIRLDQWPRVKFGFQIWYNHGESLGRWGLPDLDARGTIGKAFHVNVFRHKNPWFPVDFSSNQFIEWCVNPHCWHCATGTRFYSRLLTHAVDPWKSQIVPSYRR